MKVRELKLLIHLLDNDDAEVYINEGLCDDEPDNNIWGDKLTSLNSFGNRKYVHPRTLIVAQRPCKETSECKESLVLYFGKN